jgi:hypothetical protein
VGVPSWTEERRSRPGPYKYLVEQGVRITMLGDWWGDFLYLKAGTNQTGQRMAGAAVLENVPGAGPAQRVTSGTGDENMPRVSAAGDLVFAAIDNRSACGAWGSMHRERRRACRSV